MMQAANLAVNFADWIFSITALARNERPTR
jgi:hypothetical protein